MIDGKHCLTCDFCALDEPATTATSPLIGSCENKGNPQRYLNIVTEKDLCADHVAEYGPDRPVVTDKIIREGVESVFSSLSFVSGESMEDFIIYVGKHYSSSDDAFEFAKELSDEGYSISSGNQVDECEMVQDSISSCLRLHQWNWCNRKGIKPPYPIGTECEYGKITGVSSHSPASYEIQAPNTPSHSKRIIKFENVKSPEESSDEKNKVEWQPEATMGIRCIVALIVLALVPVFWR